MGKQCGVRKLLYAVTSLQMISTIERQVFDFLGYMWVPILANFLHLIFVILGLFGVYQYRLKYLLSYLCWILIWAAWNSFIVCFYLEVGQLNTDDDYLSFGTGSFSWWLVNGFGCNPEYFPDNSTLDVDESKFYLPVRPTKVTGCTVQYQYVEVTHACIQLLFCALGFVLGVYLAHYLVTVVLPRRRKSSSGNNAMYSIEYSPQVNESMMNRDNTNHVQETDFYSENRNTANGTVSNGAHMTPRRVKRRSYTRNSTRSAGKVQSNKHRTSTRSTRSLGRATGSRAINPVTRLMERDDRARNPIIDSSTSNDGTERYGLTVGPNSIGHINHAFENSRPNSLYSAIPGGSSVVSNQQSSITDCETISRPPSALTSYSNFHGQRRPMVQSSNSGPSSSGNHGDHFQITNLTQESLVNHGSRPNGPTSNHFQGTQLTQESLNNQVNPNRLIATNTSNFQLQNGFANNHHQQQQQQLPLQTNGYGNNTSYDDLPPPPPPLSSSPTEEILSRAENDSDSAQGSSISMPVPQQRSNPRRNEYVNMPLSQQQNTNWTENEIREDVARKPEMRPLPGGGSIASSASPDIARGAPPPLAQRGHNYANMGFSYMPEPSSDVGRHFQIGSRSSRYTDSSAEESLSLGNQNGNQNVNYNDMMTLRMDARLNYHPEEQTPQQQPEKQPQKHNDHFRQQNQNDPLSNRLQSENLAQKHNNANSDNYTQRQQNNIELPQRHQNHVDENFKHRQQNNVELPQRHQNHVEESFKQRQQNNIELPQRLPMQNDHIANRQKTNEHFSSRLPQLQSTQPSSLPQPKPIISANHRRPAASAAIEQQNQQPTRHISLDYDFARDQSSALENPVQKTGIPQRVPIGNQKRDRASLRAKHRQDMEEQKLQKQQKSNGDKRNHLEDDYGFTPAASSRPLPILKNNQPGLTNGSGLNGHQAPDDKWYLHDSMKPVGAPQHGGNCKCYRCQRKLTAI